LKKVWTADELAFKSGSNLPSLFENFEKFV